MIGGGVVGASVLYHLTKRGWTDVVLIERDELTSGSTWHAAGGMHTLNGDPNVAKLQKYTIELYQEIEEASGQSCGIHITGGVDLAGTPERLDLLKLACARGRYLGLGMEMISIDEAARLFPLLDKRHFVGALYNPLEGHVDPAGVTHAYAKAARNLGAEVYRFTRVTDLDAAPDGTWDVITEKGNLRRRARRQRGRPVGARSRAHGRARAAGARDGAPVPHHRRHAGGRSRRRRRCCTSSTSRARSTCARKAAGMLIGTYETAGVPWSPSRDAVGLRARAAAARSRAHRAEPRGRLPRTFRALERAGIKRIVNGPFTFAPDGNPLDRADPGPAQLLGRLRRDGGIQPGRRRRPRARELDGRGRSGLRRLGDGRRALRRLGDARPYTNAKVRENYSRRFRIRFPNEELPAARPLRTTPIYDRLQAKGAVFGAAIGLEHALWFAPAGHRSARGRHLPPLERARAVGDECRAVRDAVGLLETSTFSRNTR